MTVRVGGIEQLEQLDQPGAHRCPLVAGRPPHQGDQPVERAGHILVEQLHVGGGERRLDVVGSGVGDAAIASGPWAVARIKNAIWRTAPLASAWFGSSSRIA